MQAKQYQFDLTSGAQIFDFANTAPNQKLPERGVERVSSYADLLAFALQASLISPSEFRSLAALAQTQPARAQRTLKAAHELRSAIYSAFATIAAHRLPSPGDLDLINSSYAEAIAHSSITRNNGRFVRSWQGDDSPARPLWPIAASAYELLTSDVLGNIRECASDECSWLFLDQSRNQSRRWCDMKTCGNREKARRHYHRVS